MPFIILIVVFFLSFFGNIMNYDKNRTRRINRQKRKDRDREKRR